MSLRNGLDSPMFDELDQSLKENVPAFLILFLVGEMLADQGGDELLLGDLEQELELLSLCQELNWFDEVLEILLVFDNSMGVLQDFTLVFELGDHLVYEIDGKVLNVLGNLCFVALDSQVELVGLLVNGDQEEHALLVFPVDSQQVRNQLPVTVNVNSEILLLVVNKVVNFRARVLIGKAV